MERIQVAAMSVRLILIGGFLGSGKTSLMLALAGLFAAEGRKVGIITNDQGDYLVDTEIAIERGFAVKQVSSGCFCCKFGEFVQSIESLAEQDKPDIILAEPVGSCTDLVSTLILPLQAYYSNTIRLTGFYILADSWRLLHSFSELTLTDPRTPEETLLAHQIAEAGTILLSKTDLLAETEIAAAIFRLKQINSRAEIFPYSVDDPARLALLAGKMLAAPPLPLDLESQVLDYDVYARAEAELGWYNGSWDFVSDRDFSVAEYLFALSRIFSDRSLGTVRHGKLFLLTKDSSIKLSFVEGMIRSDAVQTGSDACTSCKTLINIRAKSRPETIRKVVEEALERLARDFSARADSYLSKSLVPSPPEPEHRISSIRETPAK